MKRFNVLKLLAVLFVFSLTIWGLVPSVALGAVPQLISLQGRLADANGNPVADGPYPVKFEIFNSVGPGGGCLWEENQSVTTQGGLFSVVLGSNSQGIPDSAFSDSARWLAITVGNDPEMTPRMRLTSGTFSYRVNSVEGAKGGNIYGDLTLHSTLTSGDYTGSNGFLVVTDGVKDVFSYNSLTGIFATFSYRTSIGQGNWPAALYSFLVGYNSEVSGAYGSISGGASDTVSGEGATVGGGILNKARGNRSVVSGGHNNEASSPYATVGGGFDNFASGDYATAAGGATNFANGFFSTVGGGAGNRARDSASTVGGGSYNKAGGKYSVVSGGGGGSESDSSSALGDWSAIGGGKRNIAGGDASTVSGGEGNTANGNAAAIGGGNGNKASGVTATVGGGVSNIANGFRSTVGGGQQDTASGSYATVPGGLGNKASGDNSFAAGQQAKAAHNGSFVWADGSGGNFASTGTNQFLIRATGGVGIGTTGPDVPLQVRNLADSGGIVRIGANAVATGVQKKIRFGDGDFVAIGEDSSTNDRMEIKAGTGGIFMNTLAGGNLGAGVGIGTAPTSNWIQVSGGAYCDGPNWVSVSSRKYKTDIRPLENAEYSEILKKLDKVDVVRFRYKQDISREHIGLIAEDVPEEIASNDRRGIPPNDAIAFLMAAVKAQQNKIQELEETIKQLKNDR